MRLLALVLFITVVSVPLCRGSFLTSISQLKSLVEVIGSDTGSGRPIIIINNNNNLIGHIKSGIHIATGDNEKEEEIVSGTSSTTGAVKRGLLGGPAGAILGTAATDMVISGIDSAVNKESKPYEVSDHVVNLGDKEAGKHFDQVVALGKEKGTTEGDEHNGKNPTIQSPDTRPESPGFGQDDMRLDYTLPETMDIARRRQNLTDDVRDRLEEIDFRDVNDIDGTANCYFCIAAAMRDMSATELMRQYSIDPNDVPSRAPTVDHIVNIFKRVGYKQTEVVFQGNIFQFLNFIGNNLVPGQSTSFAMAYMTREGRGHVVLARAWKDPGANKTNLLTTDFQRNVSDPDRFSQRLPIAKTFFFILPRSITYIAEDTIPTLLDESGDVIMEGMKSGCSGKRVIGYLASWSKHAMSPKQAARFTNVIFAFVRMDGDGGLTIPTDTQSKQRLLDAFVARKAMAAKGLTLSVSFAVGGWESSEHFSNVFADTEKRRHFINNVAKVLNDYDFDGVDINWEYPGTGGMTEKRQKDKAHYVSLLKELRAKLGDKKLLSIAGAAGEEALQGFDIKNIVKHVDWISVMTYDMNGPWNSTWGAFVGPNAPLYHGAPSGYSGKLNVNWAIKQYVCKSQKPEKIVLGLPFYGRFWSKTVDGKDPGSYPLFRTAERLDGKFGGDKSYRVLKNTWLLEGSSFQKKWDDRSKTPWAIHPSNNLVLSYDNDRSIKEKVQYALKNNLGGVMIWTVDQDDDELTLTKSVIDICQGSGKGVTFTCSPLEEKRWWTWTEDKEKAGMCGKSAPLYKGFYPVCDPDDPGYSCCHALAYCGTGPKFCDCPGCVDYGKNPARLVEQPVKPTRKIHWHVGFEQVKPGAPRCGPKAPPVNGFQAICNPDDDNGHCCSPGGYCGSTAEYCSCDGCKDFRKIPVADSLKKIRWTEEVRWHIGFEKVKHNEPRCGPQAPPVNGFQAICNPDDDNGHCCSSGGYCGSTPEYCSCDGCKDFRKISVADASKKIRRPEEIRWHIGFDQVKHNEPRCGPKSKKVNGQMAICDPDNDDSYCCSPWGYCGKGDDFCNCEGCVNSRSIIKR